MIRQVPVFDNFSLQEGKKTGFLTVFRQIYPVSLQTSHFSPAINDLPPEKNDLSAKENELSPGKNHLSPEENDFSPEKNELSPEENGLPPGKNHLPAEKNDFPAKENGLSPEKNGFYPVQNDLSARLADGFSRQKCLAGAQTSSAGTMYVLWAAQFETCGARIMTTRSISGLSAPGRTGPLPPDLGCRSKISGQLNLPFGSA